LTPDPSRAVHLTSEAFHMINTTFPQHNPLCSTRDQGSRLALSRQL